MKTLIENDLIPNLTCEFKAVGKTNRLVQIKFAKHFDVMHRDQRSLMTAAQLEKIDRRAFALLSAQ